MLVETYKKPYKPSENSGYPYRPKPPLKLQALLSSLITLSNILNNKSEGKKIRSLDHLSTWIPKYTKGDLKIADHKLSL